MKKLFAVLYFIILPFVVLGDVLPEPDVLINNETGVFSNNGIETESQNVDIKVAEENNFSDTSIDELDNLNEETTDEEFDPLRRLYFGFCDQGIEDLTKSYKGAGKQGEPFKMCAMFYNYSNRDIQIRVDLSDAVVDETDGSSSCTLDFSFGDFLTSGELGIFTIPADNYVIKEFEITLPIGYDGEQMGCLSYRAIEENEDELGGILFTVRKGYFMHFFVGSLEGIENKLNITDLKTDFDDNKDLILSFWVKNIGGLEDKFEIQGTIKGLFGYNKNFEILSGQVPPKGGQYVEMNLGSLPSYGGKYNIDFTINGTPYFSYDISNANVDPARLEPKSWEFSTSVFKMPWLILAVVVIFILLLIVLFKKPKQKVVYVQQQPQQPVQPQQVPQQPTQQYTQPVQPQQPVHQPVQQPVQPTQPAQQPQQPQNPNYPQN